MADRTLRARILVDTKDVDRGISDVSGKMGKLGGVLSGVGGLIAGGLAGAGVTQLFGQMVTGASDLEETLNKSRVIFGQNAAAMEQWASGAIKNFGLTKQQALETASSFGNMFSQLGFSGQAAQDMSKQVVQLSTDLGSFNNLPTAEVADMISSAFRGEYDSLQRLIPNISAARVEQEAMAATGKTNAKELTAQEKATATLAIVQRDGAAAAGDFAETSGGFANQQKILNAQLQESAATIGAALLPVLAGLMSFISGTVVPGIMAFVRWCQENGKVLGILAAIIGTVLIPALISWGVQSTIAAAKSVAAFIAAQAASIASVATQIAGFIALAVQGTITAATVVAGWVMMGVQSLLQAARMALAWVIAMGPVGWVIAAIVGLAALIIANWDKIVEWTKQAWENIVKFVVDAWNWILAHITQIIQGILWVIAPLPMLIITHWETIKNFTITIWNAISEWITQKITDVKNVIDAALNFIKFIWDAMGIALRRVWTDVILPVFNAIGTGIDTVKGWFQAGVDGIGRIWNGLIELAKGPVRFIIQTVWNDGLRNAWNLINNLWNGADLQPIPVGFAGGGSVTGRGTGKSDSILAWLSSGEHVWTAEEVKKAGGHRAVAELRERVAGYQAGGPVYQQLASIAAKMVPGTRMSSGFRPGDPGWHGRGNAADLVGNLMAINQAIGRAYPNSSELIYTPGINIKNGMPHRYSAGVAADHFDHVHWAMASAAMLYGARVGAMGGAEGTGDPFAWLREQFKKATDFVGQIVTQFGDNPITQGLVGLGKTAIDKVIEFAFNQMGLAGGGGGGAGVERWRGLVMQALGIMGLPGMYADITLRRMNQESGGNERAINMWDSNAKKGTPSKGLMQVIDPTFQTHRHPGLPNDVWNPLANVVASMRYAISRYGSLPAAYNKAGGYLLGGDVMSSGLIGVHGGEYVVNARLADAIRRSGGNATGKTYVLNVYNAGNTEIDLVEQFRRMELLSRG